jgi:hypothetical protein
VLPAASFVQELARTWDSAPFYLDASAVPVQSRAIHHPLTDIAAHARAANLSLIPATTLSASIQYQAAVASINAIDHRGVALRVDLQQLVTAASWASALTLPMTATDLVVDFAANVGAVSSLGGAIDPVFLNMHGSANWRTVTVVSSSMPENFTGYRA